jgi:prepilin-type N-terminal cleavage/methylation domain-containing protein
MDLVLDVKDAKRLKGLGRIDMKKLGRKGFTLIEMVLVIAIIVVLAIVVYFSVVDYLSAAKKATEELEEHISIIESVSEEAGL